MSHVEEPPSAPEKAVKLLGQALNLKLREELGDDLLPRLKAAVLEAFASWPDEHKLRLFNDPYWRDVLFDHSRRYGVDPATASAIAKLRDSVPTPVDGMVAYVMQFFRRMFDKKFM